MSDEDFDWKDAFDLEPEPFWRFPALEPVTPRLPGLSVLRAPPLHARSSRFRCPCGLARLAPVARRGSSPFHLPSIVRSAPDPLVWRIAYALA